MASDPGVERLNVDPTLDLIDSGTVAAGPLDRLSAPQPGVLRPPWEARYATTVALIDVIVVVSVAALGHHLALGWTGLHAGDFFHIPVAPVAIGLQLASLYLTRAWDSSVLGQGSEEFSRVVRATASSAVALGLTGLAVVSSSVRPWVYGIVPLTGLMSVVCRWMLRKLLHRRR